MYTLFIDTHFKNIVVALYKDAEMVDILSIENVVSSSVEAMPLIFKLLNNNIDVKLIKRIIVCNGPGSFTGIRIGVTLAKTMSYCIKCDIYTIDSLSLMAISNKGEVYYGTRENNGVYVVKFINNEIDGEIFYLKNMDFNDFILNNKVVVDSVVDYNKLIDNIKYMKKCNCYNANPLYVKNIEVLNDKKN